MRIMLKVASLVFINKVLWPEFLEESKFGGDTGRARGPDDEWRLVRVVSGLDVPVEELVAEGSLGVARVPLFALHECF